VPARKPGEEPTATTATAKGFVPFEFRSGCSCVRTAGRIKAATFCVSTRVAASTESSGRTGSGRWTASTTGTAVAARRNVAGELHKLQVEIGRQ